MDKLNVSKALDGIIEKLADIEHERWSHWQRYVHDKASKQPDGSLLIPAELVERWERQIETPYAHDVPKSRIETCVSSVTDYQPNDGTAHGEIVLDPTDVVEGLCQGHAIGTVHFQLNRII